MAEAPKRMELVKSGSTQGVWYDAGYGYEGPKRHEYVRADIADGYREALELIFTSTDPDNMRQLAGEALAKGDEA